MKRYLFALFTLFALFSASASIAQVSVKDLVVKEPIPGQSVSAGYFTMQNVGEVSNKLVAVSSVSADRIEMHTHTHENGMMSMKKLDFVDVPAGGSLEFVPGGHHLMVFSLDDMALESGYIELKFDFEGGELITAKANIESW